MKDPQNSMNQLTAGGAAALLAQLDAEPSLLNLAKAAKRLPELSAALGGLPLKIACVSSFTFEPIMPVFALQAVRAGFSIESFIAPYGQFEQMLINPASSLHNFGPDVVFLALRLQDMCPDLYERFNAMPAADADEQVEGLLARIETALQSFRTRSNAKLLIQNFDLPAFFALGIAEQTFPASQSKFMARANEGLISIAAQLGNAHVMDYDALVARHGRAKWADARTAFFARIPVAPEHYWHLAGFYVRHLRPLYGLSKKVLVLDADNTLWGGVAGDVGMHGIALGHDYPGNAFIAFQKRVLDLYHRGVVLCIASKNEPGIVQEIFAGHPDMVLRAEHIAAMRVNWQPKPENLRQMAADLNLGIDSFVFIDDSAVECELMRTALPEVLTVHLPTEPALYPGIIESLDCFDQWAISDEDRKRGQLYKAEAGRKTLRSEVVDMPTFYRRLEMKATIFVNHAAHVARAAQMTNRTNQFNMHTIRCSEDDIRSFMDGADSRVYTLSLADRFGENGVIGLAVVRTGAEAWTIHILLMSCRVLGRTVEQAFVGWIAGQAAAAGAKQLIGELVPTAKNKPFSTFYADRGFSRIGPQGDIQRWEWPLCDADTAAPDWLDITVEGETY